MAWTDERVEILEKLWGEGLSASQIAKELGGVTRNAVIGKVHRLGLSRRAAGGDKAEPAKETPAAKAAAEGKAGERDTKAEPVSAAAEKPAPVSEPDTKDAARAEPASVAPAGPDKAASAGEDAGDKREAAPPAADAAADTAAPANGAEPARKEIIPADQPLPPQRSANEISPETLASAREVERHARRLTLMELTERTCKWPIGDPATEDFWFCGLPAEPGKPYCETHVSVAFQPASSRRSRRRR